MNEPGGIHPFATDDEQATTKPLGPKEAAQLAAIDGVFFSRYFFPKTARQAPPAFHGQMWNILDDPAARFASFMVFRDAAKTTLCRLFTAKRIAYGLSRTAIYVGKSQDHAARSIEWLLKQIETNSLFAQTFGLRQGSKWTGTEVEIVNDVLGQTTRVIAFGITGSIRGVNVDDYRPDLIVGDDICDEENTATAEARQKIIDLWFGALRGSLAPASENPDAKQVLLGTMLDPNDVNSLCLADPGWKSLKVPVLTADEQSAWPARWTVDDLLRDKEDHARIGKLSLWMREKMCEWVVSEESPFREEWFATQWDERAPGLHVFGASDYAVSEGKGDFGEHGVFGFDWQGNLHVLDWFYGRVGPEELIERQCDFIAKYKPLLWVGESGPLRRALEPLLTQRMTQRNAYCRLEWLPSIASKEIRAQGFQAMSAMGKVWFPRSAPWKAHVMEQLLKFPFAKHDDAVDVCSLVVRGMEHMRMPKPKRPPGDGSRVVDIGAYQGHNWMRA